MLQPAGLAKGDCVSIHKVYRDIGKARQLGWACWARRRSVGHAGGALGRAGSRGAQALGRRQVGRRLGERALGGTAQAGRAQGVLAAGGGWAQARTTGER